VVARVALSWAQCRRFAICNAFACRALENRPGRSLPTCPAHEGSVLSFWFVPPSTPSCRRYQFRIPLSVVFKALRANNFPPCVCFFFLAEARGSRQPLHFCGCSCPRRAFLLAYPGQSVSPPCASWDRFPPSNVLISPNVPALLRAFLACQTFDNHAGLFFSRFPQVCVFGISPPKRDGSSP